MDEQNRNRSLAGSFFELIGPTAVIGERLALEKLGIIGRRLIHDHHQHFALEIGILVIVPFVLGSFDAIADKHNVSVNVARWILGFVGSDVFIACF